MSGPIAVGLSGGVDSAVSALLLLRQGHAVEGLHMTNWEEDEEGYCTAAQDFQETFSPDIFRLIGDPAGGILHAGALGQLVLQLGSGADEHAIRVTIHIIQRFPRPDLRETCCRARHDLNRVRHNIRSSRNGQRPHDSEVRLR